MFCRGHRATLIRKFQNHSYQISPRIGPLLKKTRFFNRPRRLCPCKAHVANVDQDGTWAGSLLLPFPRFCSCSGDREGTLHCSVHEARSLSRSVWPSGVYWFV